MKFVLALALVATFSGPAHADALDKSYSGQIVAATKSVSVKFPDGRIERFDVSDAVEGRAFNDHWVGADITLRRQATDKRVVCSRLIGELASDYSFVMKTDENEIVTVRFKASTAKNRVQISGDCDEKIARDFTLFLDDDKPLDMQATMSQDPPGTPRIGASYSGEVLRVSPKILVRKEKGSLEEIDLSLMTTGSLDNSDRVPGVVLSNSQFISKCGDFLGYLASDFTETVKTKKGMVRTATFHPAPDGAAEADQVRVFRGCLGNGLMDYQLTTMNKSLFGLR